MMVDRIERATRAHRLAAFEKKADTSFKILDQGLLSTARSRKQDARWSREATGSFVLQANYRAIKISTLSS